MQQMYRQTSTAKTCGVRLQVAALLATTMPDLVAALLERTKPEVCF